MEEDFRIWYQLYDKSGKCVSTGKSYKSYKRAAIAENVAKRMYYGLPIKWVVSRDNPFDEAGHLSKKYRTVCLA